MHLIVTRHAAVAYLDTEGKPLDAVSLNPPLTALGRRQAQALGDRVAAFGITAVYSAPAVRCLETAEAICEAVGVRGLCVPWLGESGRLWEDWHRRPPEGLRADFPRIDAAPAGSADAWAVAAEESAESPERRRTALRDRCRRVLDLLWETHPRAGEDRVCLCTHSALGGWGLVPALTLTPPEAGSRFLLDHASFTLARCDDRGDLLLRVNCTRHLAGLTAAICSRPACAYTAAHPEERQCRRCGEPLIVVCPTCRTAIPTPVAAACPHCGHGYRAE